MPPVRPKLSITLPRNFTFHYTDGQDPREHLTSQETETRQPPSTRPYRVRPRHRPGIVVTNPGGQPNPTLLLQDVPIPTIETPGTASVPPHTMNEPFPELSEGFLAPAPSRPRFFTPPKTPLAKIFTAFDKDASTKTQWESNANHGESIRRPDSACSGFSDSSDSSSDSLISFPSEGGSCTSPESEDTFTFPGYTTEKREEARHMIPTHSDCTSPRIRSRKGHGPKHVKWTDEMDNHLWKTYTLYRHDPTVTPFFVQPGGVPPLGVCCRVARQAKRSWHGPKLPLASIVEASGKRKGSQGKQVLRDVQDEANAVRTSDSPDTITGIKSGSSTPTASSEPQRVASRWPGSEPATRKRLRKLCRSKFSPSSQKEQLLRPRSTTPFRQSRATFSSVGWDRGRTTFTRDMTYSLTTSTSVTMRPDGSLAQLSREGHSSRQRNEDWFGRPLERPVNQQSQALQFGLGIDGLDGMSTRARLGSPFNDGTSDRPARAQPDGSDYSIGEPKSPFMLTEPLPYTTAVKRRAQNQLEDELSPGGSDMRVNFFEELFGAPAESSHRRVRSRGFSLGDVTRGSRLSSLITPPTMYDQMNSSEFSQNAASLQAPAFTEQTGSPPLRLGSPFADDYPSSSRARGPVVQETPPTAYAQYGRHQYVNRRSLHSFGFEPPSSIEQRLEDHSRDDRGRDDRDDSSRKRFKG